MHIQYGVSLIIPSYRNPKYLDLCLESATKNSKDADAEIIVILDGYADESRHLMEKYPDVSWLELPENKGMQYALNLGVSQSSNDLVCIINDDNVMPTNWVSRTQRSMILCNDQYGKNTVMTIQQIEPTGPGMFNFPVKDFGTIDNFDYTGFMLYESSIADNAHKFVEDGRIFPFVIRKHHYMAVGGFDTFYDSPNICDWDFFLKLELLEFKFPRTRRLSLYHFGSVATKKNVDAPMFNIKEHYAHTTYEYKWGVKPYNHPGTNSKIPPHGMFRGFSI